MSASQAYFDLVLRPNRSMDPRWFWWAVAGVAVVFFLMALRFLFLGAWPILPFMLIDLGLLWWAMRASYKSGEAAEYVRLDAERLTVRKVTAHGREQRYLLEPFWTRVELETIDDDENRLWLVSRQRRVLVGAALSPPERIEIADLMRDGLTRFKNRR